MYAIKKFILCDDCIIDKYKWNIMINIPFILDVCIINYFTISFSLMLWNVM